MKKAQWTDFFREIKKSKGRYLSLIFIVFLGTAFYTGIKSAEPDMMASADRYYDESNLMDVRVLGTLGLTEDDVQAIEDVEGIQAVDGGYSTEELAVFEDDELIINVFSPCDDINRMSIRQGRMPKAANECFMDDSLMLRKGYELGDKITLTGEEGGKPENLKGDTYTIVGSGTWSWYLSWDRGAASIGDGSLDAFMVVPEKAFDMDCYTVIYAMVDDVKGLNTFSDPYEDAVTLVVDAIEDIADERCVIRYTQIYEDAKEVLDDARKKLAEGEQELADAKQKLIDGQSEFEEGWKEYEDGVKELDDGQKEYEKGVRELEKAKEKIDSGKKEIEKQWATLEKNSNQIEDGMSQIRDGEKQIEAAEKQIAEQEQTLQSAQEEWNAGWEQYESGLEQLEAQKPGLDQGWQALNELKAQLDTLEAQMKLVEESEGVESVNYQTLKAQYDQMYAIYVEQKQTLEGHQAAYDQGLAELEAAKEQLLASKAQMEEGWEQLEEGKAELESQKQLLVEKKAELEAGKKQLEEGRKQLVKAQEEIEEGEREYQAGIKQLEEAKAQIEEGRKELAEAKEILLDAKKELEDGWKEYYEGEEEALEKFADARKEIADGEKELNDLEVGEWFVLDRNSIQTRVEYGMDAERIGAIGNVFPVIFFLVAALVSLTTMTRMIEEERTIIGTMKALGYGKLAIASKYMLYACSATLIGGVFGVIVGGKFLPYVIMEAYGMLYSNIPYILTPIHVGHSLTAIGLALLCTVGAAGAACYKELLSTPASLMRPPAPKQGKRVFLENITFLWSRLNFTMKSTLRNLIRYKKRFFMTVLGIGGCMSILLLSFGLRDSISAIVDNQYKRISTYSSICGIDEEEADKLATVISGNEDITAGSLAYQTSIDVKGPEGEKTPYIFVLEDMEHLNDYIKMQERVSGKKVKLTNVGVVLTEKLAKMVGVKVGDTVSVEVSDGHFADVKVTGITENYLDHYVYMTPEFYEEIHKESIEYNLMVLKHAENADEGEVSRYLLKQDFVNSVTMVSNLQESVDGMMNALDDVIWILIVAAGLLVFVVLFNLNNINISERRRELASLKVLGFSDMEVAKYVYRENIFLTFFGMVAGVFMGIALHRYLILTVEVEQIMFGREIWPMSYVYSIAFTIAFSFFVNVVMYYKLKKIDMVESLKSVE